MKQVKLLWYSLLVLVVFVSCNSAKTSDEILDECGSGVVLIMNKFYYKVTLPTGKVWYFTGFDEDGDMDNWTMDITEIQKNKNVITGTGFFISEDGKILTNRHVAAPSITLSDTKHSVKSMLEALAEMVNLEMQQISEKFDELEAEKNDCYSYNEYDGNYYVDNDKLQEIKDQQEELRTAYQNDAEVKDNLRSIDLSDLKVEPVCEVGVAYNNTFVTAESDFAPCVVTTVSNSEAVDLATIQLKDKKTPDDKHIFDVFDMDAGKGWIERMLGSDDSDLKTEQKLYMLGFNAGFTLSNTSQGIKAQITSGTISQKSDDNKIMYTIPSLPGSSGSPVVNEYGKLVAVNFAGVTGTQGFNYGIRIDKVRQFVENQ